MVLLGTWGTNWEQINHLSEPHDVPPKLDFFFLQQVILIGGILFYFFKALDPPPKEVCTPKRACFLNGRGVVLFKSRIDCCW